MMHIGVWVRNDPVKVKVRTSINWSILQPKKKEGVETNRLVTLDLLKMLGKDPGSVDICGKNHVKISFPKRTWERFIEPPKRLLFFESRKQICT